MAIRWDLCRWSNICHQISLEIDWVKLWPASRSACTLICAAGRFAVSPARVEVWGKTWMWRRSCVFSCTGRRFATKSARVHFAIWLLGKLVLAVCVRHLRLPKNKKFLKITCWHEPRRHHDISCWFASEIYKTVSKTSRAKLKTEVMRKMIFFYLADT